MRLLLCCLICVPSIMVGQSTAVERFQQEVRSYPRGVFVVLENDNGQLTEAFRKLLQEEVLADLRLYARTVRDNGRQTELADYLRKRYSWKNGPRWAFIAPDERCLAQGSTLPNAQVLADQLAAVGIESPVRRLRAFVRQYPENLDGKLALLNTLRSIANERTRGVLGIEQGRQDSGRQPLGGTRRMSRLAEMAEVAGVAEKSVQLSAEDDLRIWVRWADEFDRLMGSGQWLESDFAFVYGDEFLDKHSTIVRDIYRKRIGLVEEALHRWPGSVKIWGIWVHMSLVLGDRPAKRLINTLAPLPGTAASAWPPYEAKLILIQEARRNNDWRDLRDMLWESWLQMNQTLSNIQSSLRRIISASGTGSEADFMPRMLESQWRELLDPLLESLLMTGDISGADSVVNQLKETADWEEVYDLAAAVAMRCQMSQVAARWQR